MHICCRSAAWARQFLYIKYATDGLCTVFQVGAVITCIRLRKINEAKQMQQTFQ